MKREGTIAATFLAIAAVVGFSLQTGPKPEESGRVDRSGEIKRSKPALTKSATKDMPGCSSLQSELQDFLDIKKLNFPEQCLAPSDPPVKQTQQDLTSKTSQLKFVIAILPDPVHTHLPVLFDRFAVAIQEAEFVCLNYLGFVQNVLGRLRTMSMTIMVLLVASTVAMSTYPFDPRQALSAVLIALCTILGVVIVKAYADMHRDATLSHVTNTKPGELGLEFWFKIVGFGFAPLAGLLTRVFPGITDFVFSWLQPGISSLK